MPGLTFSPWSIELLQDDLRGAHMKGLDLWLYIGRRVAGIVWSLGCDCTRALGARGMHATGASVAQVSSAPPQTPGARRFRRGMSGFTLAARIKDVPPAHGQLQRHAPGVDVEECHPSPLNRKPTAASDECPTAPI